MSGSASQAAVVAGGPVTSTRLNNYPQGVLGVASATSNASATSGTTELDVLTASAVTLATANRRIRLTWHCRGISCTATSEIYTVRIKEGSTVLGESNYASVTTSVAASGGCDFSVIVDSPSAASHTYKVTIQRAIGTGSATVQATSTAPMTLTIEDVGLA